MAVEVVADPAGIPNASVSITCLVEYNVELLNCFHGKSRVH